MSLAIQLDRIESVMIAGRWYEVRRRTFDLDAYEFMDGDQCIHGGGKSGVCATGYSFIAGHDKDAFEFLMAGPLTAIEAVRVTSRDDHGHS